MINHINEFPTNAKLMDEKRQAIFCSLCSSEGRAGLDLHGLIGTAHPLRAAVV